MVNKFKVGDRTVSCGGGSGENRGTILEVHGDMVTGGVYKHENCLHAKILITKVQYRGPNYMELCVSWINFNNTLLQQDKIIIKNEDVKRWIREV